MLRNIGYILVKTDDPNITFNDISKNNKNIYSELSKYTMTGQLRVDALIESVDYVINNNIEGSIVECGVWRGGSTMAAATRLDQQLNYDKEFYLYDTFEGMSKPTKEDHSKIELKDPSETFENLKNNDNSSNWCYASLNEVKNNLKKINYPFEKFHFIKGKVEDTIPSTIPEKISILRLDTDFYESTKHELEHLFPRLVKNGILIIDDYGHWEGAKKAVDDYIDKNQIKIFLSRIDYSGRLGIKL